MYHASTYKFVNSDKELDANITFEPGDNTDATKIGLTQVCKAQRTGKKFPIDPNEATKTTKNGSAVDRLTNKNTPIYGSDALAAGKGLEDTKEDNNNKKPDATNLEPGVKNNATYELGHHYKVKEEDENFKTKNAGLYDGPSVKGGANSMKEFETTALALDGKQKGEYYGSVKWGWEKDGTGTLKKIDFDLVSKGVPSKNFMEAAEKWNDGKTRGTLVVKKNNTNGVSRALANLFKLQKGDEVIQLKTLETTTQSYVSFKVQTSSKDPSLIGKKGIMRLEELEDKGDGKETINLPLVKIKVPKRVDISLYKDKNKEKEEQKLDKKTRMKVLSEDKGIVEVEIVDGANITKTGWVKKSQLKDE